MARTSTATLLAFAAVITFGPVQAAEVRAPGSGRMFNPQPEPPVTRKLPAVQSAPAAGEGVMLRPQPEPPGKTRLPAVQSAPAAGEGVMLRPQPEPPGRR